MMEEKKESLGKIAHLYALMAWNDKYTKEQAVELIKQTPYQVLDTITYAETSIKAAIEGINKNFPTNGTDE